MPESQRSSILAIPGLTAEIDTSSVEEALRKNKPFNYGRDSSVRRIEVNGIVLCAHDYLDPKAGSRDDGSLSDMTKVGLVNRYGEALDILTATHLHSYEGAPLEGTTFKLQPHVIPHSQPFFANVGDREGYIVCTPWIEGASLNETFPTHSLIVAMMAILNHPGLEATFGSVRIKARQSGINLETFMPEHLDSANSAVILGLLVRFLTHKDYKKLVVSGARAIGATDLDSSMKALRKYTTKPFVTDAPQKLADGIVTDLERNHQESLWWEKALGSINTEMNTILRNREGKEDPLMRVVYENAKITQGADGPSLAITDPIFSFREGFAPSLVTMPRIRLR